METKNKILINLPQPSAQNKLTAPFEQSSFSVDAQGTGSFTGLSYAIPAHTNGKIKADINVKSFTSQDVKDLNDFAKNMLSVSAQKKLEEFSETNGKGSADLSFFSFLTGGLHAKASHQSIRNNMESIGLSKEQISKLIETMAEMAKKMNHVSLNFKVFNKDNDYSVSGDLQLHTISGTIKTGKEELQFRFLANQGTAGQSGNSAPAEGDIIPLS